jgi:hypothetical protein
VVNEDIVSKLREENHAVIDDNNKLKLVILKTMSQIQNFEFEELKRDHEVNVKI